MDGTTEAKTLAWDSVQQEWVWPFLAAREQG